MSKCGYLWSSLDTACTKMIFFHRGLAHSFGEIRYILFPIQVIGAENSIGDPKLFNLSFLRPSRPMRMASMSVTECFPPHFIEFMSQLTRRWPALLVDRFLLNFRGLSALATSLAGPLRKEKFPPWRFYVRKKVTPGRANRESAL